MDGNLAYQEESREEMLDGKIYLMSNPSINHYQISLNIVFAFQTRLKGKSCRPFGDGVDVYLTDRNRVIPDAMIVCNKDIIKMDGIHGVPDLIAEILSPSTTKNDRGYKKDLYEAAGVKEYWIVDPNSYSIETYLLADGKYKLNGVYMLPNNNMIDKDKESCQDTVPVSFYDGFSIPLEEIFNNLF